METALQVEHPLSECLGPEMLQILEYLHYDWLSTPNLKTPNPKGSNEHFL